MKSVFAALLAAMLIGAPIVAYTQDATPQPQRILFVGNSITRSYPLKSHTGWWGMAASQPDRDYVHRVQLTLAATTGVAPEIYIVGCTIPWCDLDLLADALLAFQPDVIVVQIGDNGGKVTEEEYIARIQAILDTTIPTRTITILTGVWYHKHLEERNEAIAAHYGIEFVPVFDLNKGGNYQFPRCAPDDAICTHPGDAGHAAIAQRIVGILAPPTPEPTSTATQTATPTSTTIPTPTTTATSTPTVAPGATPLPRQRNGTPVSERLFMPILSR